MAGARLEKHREEDRNYSVDFASELATGEALTGTPTVVIEDSANTDVTSQFGPSNIQIDGTKVEFTLAQASGSDQDGDTYKVKVTVSTDGNQTLVSVHPLYVSEEVAVV